MILNLLQDIDEFESLDKRIKKEENIIKRRSRSTIRSSVNKQSANFTERTRVIREKKKLRTRLKVLEKHTDMVKTSNLDIRMKYYGIRDHKINQKYENNEHLIKVKYTNPCFVN